MKRVLFSMLLFPGALLADHICTNSPDEVYVGNTPAGQGQASMPVCRWAQPDESTQQQAPRTTLKRGVWEDRWGAVADDKSGRLGVAAGLRSRDDAVRAATADCVARGGSPDGCRHIAITYRNGCVAYSWAGGESFVSSERTLQDAEKRALDRCRQRQGGGCELFYSDCSEAAFLGYE